MAKPSAHSLRKIFQKKTRGEDDGKSLQLIFTWPVLAVLGLVLLCAVVWAFFMGFMVGRGQHPETRMRELAGLPAVTAKETETPPKEEIIPQDGLPEETPLPGKTAVENPAPAQTASRPFIRPQGHEMAAWGEEPKPAAKNTDRKAPSDAPKKAANENQFDYTFQAAAFKSSADANNLRKKLSVQNLRANVRKSGKVYLVIVVLRGSAQAERELKAKLNSLKLGTPLLLAKKAVQVKGRKGK